MPTIKCAKCGWILSSLARHDFARCKCEAGTFIDGGFDYTRIGGEPERDGEIVIMYDDRTGTRLNGDKDG